MPAKLNSKQPTNSVFKCKYMLILNWLCIFGTGLELIKSLTTCFAFSRSYGFACAVKYLGVKVTVILYDRDPITLVI